MKRFEICCALIATACNAATNILLFDGPTIEANGKTTLSQGGTDWILNQDSTESVEGEAEEGESAEAGGPTESGGTVETIEKSEEGSTEEDDVSNRTITSMFSMSLHYSEDHLLEAVETNDDCLSQGPISTTG